MLSTHGRMSLSGLVLVYGGAGYGSVPVGVEKSCPAPKPVGKSLTWREPEAACTGNNPVGSALQETCGARWKKCRSCTFFLLFLQKPTLEGCGVLGIFFLCVWVCISCVSA